MLDIPVMWQAAFLLYCALGFVIAWGAVPLLQQLPTIQRAWQDYPIFTLAAVGSIVFLWPVYIVIGMCINR